MITNPDPQKQVPAPTAKDLRDEAVSYALNYLDYLTGKLEDLQRDLARRAWDLAADRPLDLAEALAACLAAGDIEAAISQTSIDRRAQQLRDRRIDRGAVRAARRPLSCPVVAIGEALGKADQVPTGKRVRKTT
jgi:hypothetical protein